jgi:hypothetical protein
VPGWACTSSSSRGPGTPARSGTGGRPRGAALRWLAAGLRAALGADVVNVEEVRSCLALAKRGGLDWQRLYEEAVREVVLGRPDRAPLLLPLEAVALQEWGGT